MVREMKHTEIGEIPVEWKLQTFEETFCVLSNNTLPRADLNDRGGTVRNVHYGDILTRFGEVLDCEKDEVPYLNDISLLTASAQVLQDGDVILADTAEDDTVGKATEVYGLGKGRMVAGLHTIPCRIKKGAFVPKWLGYYMNSPIYHDQVLPYVTGIKVSSISKAAISGTLIAVPPLEEQRAIVSVLSEVDQLLAELKKVVSKLRDFKGGCLYLMFPQEGSDIPQMREPGYDEPWERRKLGEMLSFSNGFNGNKGLYGRGVPYISVMDILNNDVITHDVIQGRVNVDTETAQRYLVEYGDVLFQRSSENIEDAGRSNVYADAKKTAIFGGFVIRGKKVSEYNMIFMKQNLETQLVRRQIMSCAQGAQHINVGQETLENIKAFFPSLEEQKKIGVFLICLNHLITLHQQKYDKYLQIKKAMLSELITGKIKLV